MVLFCNAIKRDSVFSQQISLALTCAHLFVCKFSNLLLEVPTQLFCLFVFFPYFSFLVFPFVLMVQLQLRDDEIRVSLLFLRYSSRPSSTLAISIPPSFFGTYSQALISRILCIVINFHFP